MEKNKGGRPATGLKRPKKMTIAFSEQETERLKAIAWELKMTVADYIISKVEEDEKNQNQQ